MLETIFSVALGLSLSASCGLRAFMPLFISGLLARLFENTVSLGENFMWLGSTPCLIALGVALVAEVAADKVPALDHLLDLIQGPVRTGAGILVCAAVMVDLPTWITAITAIVAGGGVALGVHATKATVRVGSTATTAGVANPVISLIEDGLCLGASLLSIVFAVVAVIVCAIVLIVFALVLRALFKRRKGKAPAAPDAVAGAAADAAPDPTPST